jgi:hypothetical protein
MAGPGPDSVSAGSPAPGDTLHCVNHPDTETLIRCSRCLDPICLKCAVRTEVGLRCRKCAYAARSPLYVLQPQHYVLAALVSLAAAMLAGALAPRLGLLLVFFLSAPIGGLIAEIVLRALRGKRGRAVQGITAAAILLGASVGPWLGGALAKGTLAALPASPLAYLASLLNLGTILYVVLAIGAAIARLR